MAKLEKYEVLSILGADACSTSYKIKNKDTSEVYVWKAFVYNDLKQQQDLIQEIERSLLKPEQPNSLHIYDYILYEDKKIIYVTCEFCINGNLVNVLQTCRTQRYYLDEEFLWRLLYQLAYILKQQGSFEIKLNDIFLDADFNIKLFRFKLQPCNNFAFTINELCKFGKSYYTNEFNDLVKFITIGSSNSIDAVLSHPKVLLKNCSNTAVLTDIYIKKLIVDDCADGINEIRLENIKNRELQLRNLEEKLKMIEHEIHKREKKIALQERIVKEKMTKAELYLKRCRTGTRPTKINLEDIDTSFSADCGNSSTIISTGQKLNVENIKKPANFTRTMSERRVHFKGFKGHSPLKEISWSKSESVLGSKKALFEKTKTTTDNSFRPISWTGETKQQAFDLLRLMKQNSVDKLISVQHTYL